MSVIATPNDLSDQIRRGMIPLSVLALCSAISTFTLLSWITYRLIWRKEYQAYVGYNQYVILIYNLLLADFQQALSFLITLHWLNLGRIDSPSATCFAQGWLLNMGDVSSGMFVLAIALHTWYSVVLGKKLNYAVFTGAILGVWAFSFLLTVLGPAMKGPHFFVNTNAWCWISSKYELDRLWLHYIWVFVVEFGTIVVYAHVFIHLRGRLRTIRDVTLNDPSGLGRNNRLSQAARYMVIYPIIYVILTLPLAAGRMAAMAGRPPGLIYYCVAGSLLTSCGWLDTLLYTMTRRVFIKSESSHGGHTKPTDGNGSSSGRRGWLKSGRNDTKKSSAPLQPCDNEWHLSTFATMTIDVKEPSSSHGQASMYPASESDDGDSPKSLRYDAANYSTRPTHRPSESRTGTITNSRCQTPTAASALAGSGAVLKETPQVALTSTTIRSNNAHGGVDDDAIRIPSDANAILSETTIEVVSVLRDDLWTSSPRHKRRESSVERPRGSSRQR